MGKRICNVLLGIMIAALGVLAALFFVPKILGYQELAVLTGSMEPELPVGALAYVKKTEPETLKPGDVIAYRLSDGTMVTHRITEVSPETRSVTTKGDANDAADAAPVSYDSVVGKLRFSLPFLGFAGIYIRRPAGMAAACAVFFMILLLSVLPEFFSGERKNKQKGEAL